MSVYLREGIYHYDFSVDNNRYRKSTEQTTKKAALRLTERLAYSKGNGGMSKADQILSWVRDARALQCAADPAPSPSVERRDHMLLKTKRVTTAAGQERHPRDLTSDDIFVEAEAAPSPSPVVEVSEEMTEAALDVWFGAGPTEYDPWRGPDWTDNHRNEWRERMRAALVAALRVR